MRAIVVLLLLSSPAVGQEIRGARTWTTRNEDGKVIEIDGVRCVPFALSPTAQQSLAVPRHPLPSAGPFVVPRSTPYCPSGNCPVPGRFSFGGT